MKLYIGTKKVKAEPMTRGEYNKLRGWEVPADEDPTDGGYLVEYVDGGKANHPSYQGYISWSPKDVFERAYHPVDARASALPNRVTVTDMMTKVREAVYHKMPNGTTTFCELRMYNGYTVWGKSACVDPSQYNQALGEKYAFEDAVNQLWPLEGYLLAERRAEKGLV